VPIYVDRMPSKYIIAVLFLVPPIGAECRYYAPITSAFKVPKLKKKNTKIRQGEKFRDNIFIIISQRGGRHASYDICRININDSVRID